MHAIHATNQVDKTLAFYTEVFGIGGKVTPFAGREPCQSSPTPRA